MEILVYVAERFGLSLNDRKRQRQVISLVKQVYVFELLFQIKFLNSHTKHLWAATWYFPQWGTVCPNSKGSDQPAHTRSLIRPFARRLNILWL